MDWYKTLIVIVECDVFDVSVIIGGHVGLAITQIFNLIIMSRWGMQQTAELENSMTSVERVMEYIDLVPETQNNNNSATFESVADDWPKNGAIEFVNLSMRYSEHSDAILKLLNLRILPGSKIGITVYNIFSNLFDIFSNIFLLTTGIVGRTGAGKSSIIQAIFRLAHNDGIIRIDDIDISNISLEHLRKRISIIPQDPILFSGTMRDNLDPFHEKSDDELWNALDQVCYKFYKIFFSRDIVMLSNTISG